MVEKLLAQNLIRSFSELSDFSDPQSTPRAPACARIRLLWTGGEENITRTDVCLVWDAPQTLRRSVKAFSHWVTRSFSGLASKKSTSGFNCDFQQE